MALLKRASRVLMKPSERGDWMSAELEGNGHGWTNGRRATASVAAALVSLLAFSASAGAATYTPNTTADGPAVSADCPPDATPTAACSLRDPGDETGWLPEALEALADAVRRGRLQQRLQIERFDGEPIVGSPFEQQLIEVGFRQGPRKLTLSA